MCRAAAFRVSQKNGVFQRLYEEYETTVELDEASATHEKLHREMQHIPMIPSDPWQKGIQANVYRILHSEKIQSAADLLTPRLRHWHPDITRSKVDLSYTRRRIIGRYLPC
eukprot:1357704-Pyramimonas_sp.AAC.1